ncbi:MAG TPA: serine/threonine-protein kinase, partial [Kofleriaceae bacterium]|nr:serine/threonine-protein kinase [Kofleriaceae bacterium]
MTWTPPTEFEEYRIIRPLGAGTMGQVFLAHDQLLDRAVAIKFINGVDVDASARERFYVEARAVARLSHPNVVAIHRVGEVRRRPFLVSEYVRGDSLANVAKPMPWERALKIGIGLARGLGSAHRRGVLHRDIKPANVVIGTDDEAKLLDFGLAKLADTSIETVVAPVRCERGDRPVDATASIPGRIAHGTKRLPSLGGDGMLTEAGAIVGTPLYLAPELWTGASASYQTDVYALGVVMYELLAGRAPHAGLAFAELERAARDDEAGSIAALAPTIPTRLADLVDACLSRDPAKRPASGDALCERLEAVVPPTATVVDGSPYRGLSTFELEHRSVFFGRAEETRAVVERLRTETLVIVAGDSGAGKSSLCRAAVVPAVTEKSLAGRRWDAVMMTPGPRPRAALETALSRRSGNAGLLLFVDQLEELLTVSDRAEATWVAEQLADLVIAGSDIRVLASARTDFLGRLAELPGLGELVGRALYLLGPLGERGLREAIVGPARALGYEFGTATMIDELVTSGRRHLPLLQFTLAELWDARDDKARRVPADALERIGGVAGALARRADQVMAALGDADREIAW